MFCGLSCIFTAFVGGYRHNVIWFIMRYFLFVLFFCVSFVLAEEYEKDDKEIPEACSSGLYITGYFIPDEKDFKGPKVSINIHGETYHFKEDFVKAVKMEGDGKSEYGWYLHCCWSKASSIIGACGKELIPMKSVARDTAMMKCETTLEIRTPLLQGKTFVAHDTGGAIKGKHLDVFCGYGEEGRKMADKITTHDAEVCVH